MQTPGVCKEYINYLPQYQHGIRTVYASGGYTISVKGVCSVYFLIGL